MHENLSIYSLSLCKTHIYTHPCISKRTNAKKIQLISGETINKQNHICNLCFYFLALYFDI